MTALSSDQSFDFKQKPDALGLKVKGSTTIYKGAMVGIDRSSGYARGLTSADQFQGMAAEHSDNSSGSNGDTVVTVLRRGLFKFALSGAAITDIGLAVFASDDATITKTGAANAYVGRIVDYPESDAVIVDIDPQRRHVKSVTAALTSDAKSPILACRKPITVVNVLVWAETKPSAGALDVGTDDSDPDEIVDDYDLTGLTDGDVTAMTLAGSAVAEDTRIYASVSNHDGTAMVAGGLTLEYVEAD